MRAVSVGAVMPMLLLCACGCERLAAPLAIDPLNAQTVTFMSKQSVRVEFADPARIQRLASMLTAAKRTDEQKCAACGDLMLHLRSGELIQFGFLLGHGGDVFELRQESGMWTVPRSEFLAIFELPPPDDRRPDESWPAAHSPASTPIVP
ncbi:MAG: hypothetical protein HZB38_15940 [Planctomycetes bacterium]|nr:hypothetical protein [Planctomycetota bacterium]